MIKYFEGVGGGRHKKSSPQRQVKKETSKQITMFKGRGGGFHHEHDEE
jgi:hypothetical protein